MDETLSKLITDVADPEIVETANEVREKKRKRGIIHRAQNLTKPINLMKLGNGELVFTTGFIQDPEKIQNGKVCKVVSVLCR